VNGWIAPRTAFGAAIAENKLYVFGGQSAHGALNDLHYLDLGELILSRPSVPARHLSSLD
jgi:hypothetical protein